MKINSLVRGLSVLVILIFTGACFAVFIRYVDLKPQVDEHFFFSSDDPQFQDEKKIAKIFTQDPQVILAARGDIYADAYTKGVAKLTLELETLPDLLGIQSIAKGPGNAKDAMQSPLWQRTLIAQDKKSTFIILFLKKNPDTLFIRKLEDIRSRLSRPDFEIMISGGPYIVELIRRSLYRDLQIFSLAALIAFSLALLIIFRSIWIVTGVVISCFNASALTLIIAKFIHLEMGFLTANLPTIVFVLTLSHIAFMTADWKQRVLKTQSSTPDVAWEAVKSTFYPAVWSTFTALLGFVTLLFVQAKSLRQLGYSGCLGTFMALACAYVFYPWFLAQQSKKPYFINSGLKKNWVRDFFSRRHPGLFFLLGGLTVFGFLALPRLDTDPSLFAYFKKNSEIRNGLEYIDLNGGSNPLTMVIESPNQDNLNTRAAHKKMWDLHLALEKDPAVGNVVSIPVLLMEAKRSFLGKFLMNEWIMTALESPRFGEVAKYFITPDRKQALFFLRMKEHGRKGDRLKVVERIKNIVRDAGYVPALTGGVFVLQGRLSQLVASSLISGSLMLNGVILLMTWILSRSWRVSLAMLLSLYFVPVTMLGLLAFLKIPLDVIAAPAANVAIGLGVDSMIHLIIKAKREDPTLRGPQTWANACTHLWDPILWSTLMVASGFSIFMLSNFPPTQRFGFSVVLGTVLSPFATLFILPWLGGLFKPSKPLAAAEKV